MTVFVVQEVTGRNILSAEKFGKLELLLPEGYQLEALLKRLKIDRDDPFSQLIATGKDMVGSVTIKEF